MEENRKLFLYPFVHSNGFVERIKGAFSELGYDIQPFKKLFRPANLFSRDENWLVLNWYEDQPFRKGMSGPKRWAFLSAFFLTVCSIPLFSSKVIWVRHNYKPHNVAEKSSLYNVILRLLSMVADRIVTLEMTDKIESSVVKHPLYFNDRDLFQFFEGIGDTQKSHDFLYFGSIKPYKRLDKLLEVWPVAQKLEVMGFCSDKDYAAKLHGIIEQRGLQVDWNNAFVKEETLEAAISNTRFVIMAHDDNAMISSGTFYMAMSLGANVLCFDSAFARMKAREFPFVKILQPDNLESQLANLDYVDSSVVINQAVAHYGEQAIRESWRVGLST